jgi:hypothetical protein
MVKIIILLSAVACGCGPKPEAPSLAGESGTGGVVAEVDGAAIYASAVEEAAGEAGLSPPEALSSLIDERIAAQEAADRGFLADGDVVRNWKKALVQKVLEAEVEDRVPEESVTLEDIRKYYAANFAGRGLLLEQVWKDIRDRILVERRNIAYQELVERLEAEHADEIKLHTDTIERLK